MSGRLVRCLCGIAALMALAGMSTGCAMGPDRSVIGPIAPIPDPVGTGACQHVAWSPDSRLLAVYGIYGFDGDRPTVRRTVIVSADDGSVRSTIENAMWPSFSPDGRRIVFAVLEGKDRELYSSSLDGSDRVRLTANPADDLTPAWSPRRHGGELIAFCSNRDGKRRVYVMGSDGSNVHQVTHDDAADYNPEWSFDGSRLTFYREKGDGLDQVYTVRPDGTDLMCVTGGVQHNTYPAFTRDQRMLFQRSEKGAEVGELVVFDPATGGSIVLSTRCHFARQSPDGRRIAYIAKGHRKNAVFIANSDGSDLRKLVE
ncbi:MAG: TolB family protein [Phycisphaerae bacterium]